jgi:uncharacterized membrane protein YedE/YeeE
MAALNAVPVDRITARARQVSFRRSVLVALAGLLFGFGWVIAKVFSVAWLSVVWCAVAVSEGWREAHDERERSGGPGRPR